MTSKNDAQDNANQKTPLVVVAGYLGAGKTTLIRELLPSLDARGLKGVLIENEIGEMNVDGALAGDTSIQQIELLGGCVCCSMRGDLFSALSDALREYRPDYLLIEASGLAEPAEIVDAATAEPLNAMLEVTDVINVADAANLGRQLTVGALAKEQARFASAVVLNKIDAVRDSELAALQATLRELNPSAPIWPVENAQAPVDQLLARSLAWLAGQGLQGAAAAGQAGHDHHHHHHHHHHAGHYALNVDLPDELSKEQLLAMIEALPDAAYRVKGFARIAGSERPWVFQRVGGMPARATEFTLDGVPVPIGMVLIGPRLEPDAVADALAIAGAKVRSVTD